MLKITDKILFEVIDKDNNSIIITDNAGIILYVNKKFLSVTGYKENDVIGKHSRILKSGEMKDEIYKNLWETISSGKTWQGEFLNKKKNGIFYWQSATIIPLFDDNKKIISYIGIQSDIDDKKLYEKKLKESNENKTKLISILSHDLRSPFATLMSYIDILYNEINDLNKEEMKIFLYNALSLSKQINMLLNNLLNWSKLELNVITPSKIKINFFDFVNYIFEILKFSSDEKNIKLINNVDSNINIYVDENMIYSILYNLIYNAIKFTNDNGNITISTYKNTFNNNRILISIKDTGIGMTKEQVENLFNFNDNNKSIKVKSTGLGLFIVKEFLEKMGSKIEVKSEKNKGTEFIFDVELYKK